MRRQHSLVIITTLALVACGRDADDATQSDTTQAAHKLPKQPKKTPKIYDAEGQLLESVSSIAGLKLPVATTMFREADKRKIYRTQAPVDKVLGYFGPRLTTGLVDRLRNGAVYREAKVRGQESDLVRLTVTITAIDDKRTRTVIELLPPKSARQAQEPPKTKPVPYKPPRALTEQNIQEAMKQFSGATQARPKPPQPQPQPTQEEIRRAKAALLGTDP